MRTCWNGECLCKARCATPHPEKERENMESPLLAVLDGESILCQHDQKGTSCFKNQRRIFWKLLFLPAAHKAQGRNTIPLGRAIPMPGPGCTQRRKGKTQSKRPWAAELPFPSWHRQCPCAQHIAFTAPCSGPHLHLPGERII